MAKWDVACRVIRRNPFNYDEQCFWAEGIKSKDDADRFMKEPFGKDIPEFPVVTTRPLTRILVKNGQAQGETFGLVDPDDYLRTWIEQQKKRKS